MKKAILLLTMFLSVQLSNAATPLKHYATVKADSVYICQSKSAYAYHSYQCSGLSRCKHGIAKVSKAEAVKMGYKPCKICYR